MPKLHAPSLAEHNDRAWTVLTGALDELLATTPYDEITMSRVAASAGMARNTLYNYGPDKSKLVAAITGRASAALLSEMTALAEGEGSAIERMEAITRAILAWFVADGHRHVVARGLFGDVLPGQPNTPDEAASAPLFALQAEVASLIAQGVARGELRRLPDPDLTMELLSAIMRGCVLRIVRQPSDLALVTQEAIRIVRACLAPEIGASA